MTLQRRVSQHLDKAPRPSNSNVIWILSSDTDTICELNQLFSNSEAGADKSMICKPESKQEGDNLNSPQYLNCVMSILNSTAGTWHLMIKVSNKCC